MKIVENKNTKTKGYIAIGAAVLLFAFLMDSDLHITDSGFFIYSAPCVYSSGFVRLWYWENQGISTLLCLCLSILWSKI